MRPIAHSLRRLPVLGALVAVLALPSAAVAAGGGPTADQLDAAGVHEIIVKRAPGVSAGAGAEMRASADVTFASAMRLDDTEVVRARPGRLAAALSALRADPDVVYAEPNAPVEAATADAYWRDQWGLENTGQLVDGGAYRGAADADVDAPQAWALATTKGAGQTVAVVDSGVNAGHPDLIGQIAAGGADLVDHDGVPNDTNGHGSHVAGIVAGRQDTTGITGIAPGAKVLGLRVLDANGRGTSAQVANAFDYAGDMGVAIVNASLSSPAPSQAEMDAIRQHPDTLFVLAAGNGGTDGVGDDNDVTPGREPGHDRRARRDRPAAGRRLPAADRRREGLGPVRDPHALVPRAPARRPPGPVRRPAAGPAPPVPARRHGFPSGQGQCARSTPRRPPANPALAPAAMAPAAMRMTARVVAPSSGAETSTCRPVRPARLASVVPARLLVWASDRRSPGAACRSATALWAAAGPAGWAKPGAATARPSAQVARPAATARGMRRVVRAGMTCLLGRWPRERGRDGPYARPAGRSVPSRTLRACPLTWSAAARRARG